MKATKEAKDALATAMDYLRIVEDALKTEHKEARYWLLFRSSVHQSCILFPFKMKHFRTKRKSNE